MSPSLLSVCFLLTLLRSAAAHAGHHDDDADSGTDLRWKPLILVKIWCLILVFVTTFVGGVSPYFLKWNEAFLLLGTQFAGGVFLGTALMHFLSDSDEAFSDLTAKEYPFAFMLAAAGYLVTMLADSVVAYVYGKTQTGGGSTNNNGDLETQQEKRRQNEGVPAHHISAQSLFPTATSIGDSILLIIALCFHSIFEGIAIGVADTESETLRALWTVSLHKIFAAIAMGIALLRMLPHRPLLSCVAYAFAFAISSPIGVAIGIVIDATTEGNIADWIYAVSMGLACGIFIYVSINHLLAKGYISEKRVSVDTPGYKFMVVSIGVAVIAVVMIWD